MLQWFIRFPEFSEILFHLEKSPVSLVDDSLRIYRRQNVGTGFVGDMVIFIPEFLAVPAICICFLASSRMMILSGEIAWLYSIFYINQFLHKSYI